MAFEGFHYWKDWENYLEVEDERGTAKFIECGGVYLGNDGALFQEGDPALRRDRRSLRDLGHRQACRASSRYRRGGTRPSQATRRRRVSGRSPDHQIGSVVFSPAAGYVTDPQLASHNLQRAAEAKGGEFLFNAEVSRIRIEDGRVAGVDLADGQSFDAPIVVNVAGPHSFVINEMAGVADSMNIKTRALRHEVHHVPAPRGMNWDRDGCLVGDDDMGTYFRPEVGNNILLGSQDPECDPQEWVDDPDEFNRTITEDQWHVQTLRLAKRLPVTGGSRREEGGRRPLRRERRLDPDLRQDRPRRLLRGDRHQRQPVQELSHRRLLPDPADQGGGVGPRPRCRSGQGEDALHRASSSIMGAFSRNREINRASSFSVLG